MRRTVLAFVVSLVCALAVFTLPRFAWNTIQAAGRQQPAAPPTTAQSPPPPAAPPAGASRTAAQRLTGVLGIAFILGLGIALSRNRRAISRRVVAWGLGLQLVFAIFVLRVPFGQRIFSALGEIVKQQSSLGVVFAFQVLPAIIFVSALFAILYYLGVMQLVVKAFAVVMNRVMGASGAERLNVAASIFMGQPEAPR